MSRRSSRRPQPSKKWSGWEEIPVSPRRFSVQHAVEERDPLGEDDINSEDVLSSSPRERSSESKGTGIRSKIKVDKKSENCRSVLSCTKVKSCVEILSSEQLSLPATALNLRPQEDFSFKDLNSFRAEMDRNISDIIDESLYLFEKDPREYHPFYLRVYKYIRSGQQQGFITSLKDANSYWEKYDKICELLMSSKKDDNVTTSFTGVKSPYAIFIKTGKVVLNGREVNLQRNQLEINKMLDELEKSARELVGQRKRLRKSNTKIKDIRSDLIARLNFFNLCKTVTFPAECVKMNEIWYKFVTEFAENTECRSNQNNLPVKPKPVRNNKAICTSIPLSGTEDKAEVAIEIPSEPIPILTEEIKLEENQDVVVVEADEDSDNDNVIDDFLPEPDLEIASYDHNDFHGKVKGTLPHRKNEEELEMPVLVPEKEPDDFSPAAISSTITNKTRREISVAKSDETLKAANKKDVQKSNPVKDRSVESPKAPTRRGSHKLKIKSSHLKRTRDQVREPKVTSKHSRRKTVSNENNRKRPRNIKLKYSSSSNRQVPLQRKKTGLLLQTVRSKLSRLKTIKGPTAATKRKRQIQLEKLLCSNRALYKSKKNSDQSLQHSTDLEMESEQLEGSQLTSKDGTLNLKSRENDNSIICDQCGVIFANERSAREHKRQCHTGKSKCPMCDKEFTVSESLWVHFRREHTHEGKKLYEGERRPQNSESYEEIVCELCAKSFMKIGDLKRHMLQNHGSGEKTVKCPDCSKMFKATDIMYAHRRQVHLGQDFRCEICSRKCQSVGKLWRHKVDLHGMSNLAPPPGLAIFKCDYCDESLLRGMLQHVKKHHPEKVAEFKEIKARNRKQYVKKFYEQKNHKRLEQVERRRRLREECRNSGVGPAWMVRTITPKTCPRCKVQIPGRSREFWITHLKEKHNDTETAAATTPRTTQYVCPVADCKKDFYKHVLLERHIRGCHIDLEKILIETDFVQKRALEEGSDWLCNICHRSMRTHADILVHFYVNHQQTVDKFKGEKEATISLITNPVECFHKCGESFENEKLLRKHVLTSHSELCWKCPECEMPVISPNDLQEHFMLEHNLKRITAGGKTSAPLKNVKYVDILMSSLNYTPNDATKQMISAVKREKLRRKNENYVKRLDAEGDLNSLNICSEPGCGKKFSCQLYLINHVQRNHKNKDQKVQEAKTSSIKQNERRLKSTRRGRPKNNDVGKSRTKRNTLVETSQDSRNIARFNSNILISKESCRGRRNIRRQPVNERVLMSKFRLKDCIVLVKRLKNDEIKKYIF